MRARGANTRMRVLFESVYGTVPSGNFLELPFVSSTLGAEQGFLEDDLLGAGREPFDPTEDVITNTGDLVVPVDTRFFGHWLRLYFGNPTSAPYGAATGTLTFSDQPAADSTITIDGTLFTFKTSGANGNQINIGADVAATVAAIATKLNAASGDVAAATYSAATNVLTVTHDTLGTAGNAFELAAGAGSNAVASGATLSGGTIRHIFQSGAITLPSASIGFSMTDVGRHGVNYGAKGNQMRISLVRKGQLNATLSMIAKGERKVLSTAFGTVAPLSAGDITRFASARGEILLDGQAVGNINSSDFIYSNNLEAVETVQPDGEIEGADEGKVMVGGDLKLRFANQDFLDAAIGTPVTLTRGWSRGSHSLVFSTPRVFIPRVKKTFSGPAGIEVTAQLQASGAGARAVTATLINDVASYT